MAGQPAIRDEGVSVRLPYLKHTSGGIVRYELPKNAGTPVRNLYISPDAFVNGFPQDIIVTVTVPNTDDG
jgi:hypothetical protein